jgi:hypothetical protein
VRLKLGIALAVIGVLCAVPLVVRAVASTASTVTAKSHRTPVRLEEDLGHGRYVVFERTGTGGSAGPISGSVNGAPTLTPAAVRVTGPDGAAIDVRYLSNTSETIHQGNAIFTGVLQFDVDDGGPHRIAIGGEGRQVLVTRSIASQFGALAGVFGLAVAGGSVFLVGFVLLVLEIVRRGRTPAVPAAAHVAVP